MLKTSLPAARFLTFLTIFAANGLHAQSRMVDAATIFSPAEEVSFEHVATEQGPSTGTINCIIQDRLGFLWLGTANGLLRYDGYEFKAYKHHPADTSSISGNHIWSICEDRGGDLWIGTSQHGLSRYVRSEERFIRYRHDPNDSTSLGGDHEVPAVYQDAAGELWIALWEAGLDHYLRNSDRFVHRRLTIKDQSGEPKSSVHRICEDRTRLLWIGTKHGVYKLDRETNFSVLYRHDPRNPRSLGGDNIYAIHEDRSGNLWCGAAGGGLSRYDSDRDDFVVYRHDSENPISLSGNQVSAIAEDSSGGLWISTFDGGLNRLDTATGGFSHYDLSSPEAPHVDEIASLLVDKTGILWVGTVGAGLYCHVPQKRKFAHYQQRTERSPAIVDAIFESADRSLWIGTAGSGLHSLTLDEVSRQYVSTNSRLGSLSSSFVSALCEDLEGNLWVGFPGGGINRFDRKSGRFARYRHDPNNQQTLSSDKVSVLLADREGNLWAGTDGGGLNIYHRQRDTFQKYLPDSTTYPNWNHVMALFEDRRGDIWAGTWGEGVIKFNADTTAFTAYKPRPEEPSTIAGLVVSAIAEDGQGNLWFGTWGEGLNRFDRASNQFTRYTSADGLPSDIIYGILPDDQGHLWISTNNGLAKFNPTAGTWKTYGMSDGIQSTEFRRGACHKGRSGRFYFGGINGFNAFYPERIRNNPHVPPVVITDFQILNRPVSTGGGAWLNQMIAAGKPITLSYQQSLVSFEFAALDYTAPEKNRYAYKLEGFHDDWIDLGARRFVSFTNLDAGEYVFRVKGSNNDGVWNEHGAAVGIRIMPPPWKTWWAYALYALIGLTALLSWRRYELRKAREKSRLREAELRALAAESQARALQAEKEIEKQQIRNRIAADLHDEIGSNLSSIALMSEMLQNQAALKDELQAYFADIHQAARSSTEAVRDIVWFINPGSDQLSDLIARMEATARSMLAGLPYELKKNGAPFGKKLDPEIKRNFYLIYKEILANIIKHSQANRVSIEIMLDASDLAFRIEDNGVGFDSAASSSGRGLINLRERIAQIGGHLSIQTAPGQGTTVLVSAKITSMRDGGMRKS